MGEKLTKKFVDSIEPGDRDIYEWDSELSGFGLVVRPSGAKSFVFQYRTAEGISRRIKIGNYSDALTADQARKLAKERYRDVLNGIDPLGEKRARRNAITVDKLLDLYVESEKFKAKADSTRVVDAGRIDRHVRPLLGSKVADKVTENDVRRMQRSVAEGATAVQGKVKTKPRGVSRARGGAGTADKAVLILRAAYSWAIDEKMLDKNPAAGIEISPPGKRETIIEGAADYGRLFKALDTMQQEHRMRPAVADAIRFIALTGARRGEVIGMKWKHVDLRNGRVIFPPREHKTGRKTGAPRIIMLPTQAREIIARQTDGEPESYVFKPAKGGGPISMQKPWQQVRNEAELPDDLVLHGLRHSIGTHLAMNGGSTVELMHSLGHKQISTTLRYIHFADNARSTLAERAAAVALAGMHGGGAAEVKELPKKSRKKTAA